MRRHLFLKRFFVVVFALLLVSFIVFMSLWRINYSAVGKENHEVSVSLSAPERIRQLLTPPILPGHPLYILGMIVDRVDLMIAPRDQQFALRLQYANTRLTTAQLLIERGQLNLALSTITKAEKYVLAAAADITQLPQDKQSLARQQLHATIILHKSQLILMKPSFSDGGRSIIDGIIEQISVLRTNR